MKKRIALIIGATGTFGSAIAKALAKKNIKLILVSKDLKKLKKLQYEIHKNTKIKPFIIALDLSHGRSIDKLGGKIFLEYKKLDIMINSASFFPKLSPINHINPKDFNKIVNINIIASWNLIRSCDPLLRFSDYGRAYFLICKQKIYKEPYFSSYSLTSSSIESMIKNWKNETKKTKIKISTFDPGPILSNLRASVFPGENPKNLNTAEKPAQKLINIIEKSY